MKHSVLVISALLLLLACTPRVPSDVIQPGDMEDILYDYHVAQAMAREEMGKATDFNNTKYYLAVLKKHGVTEAEFDSSLVYYYSHIDRLKDIYSEVNTRLADDAKALGASVGDISRYSQYGTTGDTANIWKEATDVLLMPRPTMNRYDFTIKADTSFRKGDSFMFQFMTDYLWQNGMKDAVVCIVTKYEGDSIIQTVNHVSVSGIAQIRVPTNRENKLKEIVGFIYMGDGGEESDTRKMMFVSQMQFIRFHNKNLQNETSSKVDSVKTDSVQRSDNPGGPMPDSVRRGIIGRRLGGTPVPPTGRTAPNRVDARAAEIKVMH